MRIIVPVMAALVVSGAAALAGGDSFSSPDGPPPGEEIRDAGHRSLYDKIYARYAHYGRDVEEEFHDGPCTIERHWERDGDFEERIKCKGAGH